MSWLSGKMGDVYPHETAIAHIRRLLSGKFATAKVGESLKQFRRRLDLVEQEMNSDHVGADADKESLMRVSKCMRDRCQKIIDANGERIPF